MCKYYDNSMTVWEDCQLRLVDEDDKVIPCHCHDREWVCERFKKSREEQKEKSELFNKVVFELNTIESIESLIKDLKKQKEKAIKKAAQVYYWSKYKCPNDEVQAEVDRLHHKDLIVNENIEKEREIEDVYKDLWKWFFSKITKRIIRLLAWYFLSIRNRASMWEIPKSC